MRLSRWFGLPVAALLLGSCSLLEKLAEQEFLLRADFKVDTTAGKFPPFRLPSDACVSAPECCPRDIPPEECDSFREGLVCEMSACRISIAILLVQEVDIPRQVTAFQNAKRLTDIRIGSLVFAAKGESNLNIGISTIDLFVAPREVTSTSDPRAQRLGTFPPLGPKETGEFEIEFAAMGQRTLETYLEKAGSPFNLILASQVVLGKGELATGMMNAEVTLTAKAKPEI